MRLEYFKGSLLLSWFLYFFRSSIVDGTEFNPKTLSVKLTLKMKSHKPENLDKLKTVLIAGRLGKFKVANFPSIVDGMPPMSNLGKFCC